MALKACDEQGNFTDMNACYLKHLTATEELEELRLWFHPHCQMIAWGEISPTRMPNLKCLSVGNLDQRGYDYFTSPEMATFLRGIHLSILQPGFYLQDSSRLSVWQHGPVQYVLDMFNDEGDWSLQPLGLEIDLAHFDNRQRRNLPGAPWSWLKYLKAVLPVNKGFLRQFGSEFVKNMVLLEAICIELRTHWYDRNDRRPDHGIDEHRLRHIVRSAAWKCPKLEYVSFYTNAPWMPLFKTGCARTRWSGRWSAARARRLSSWTALSRRGRSPRCSGPRVRRCRSLPPAGRSDWPVLFFANGSTPSPGGTFAFMESMSVS